MTCTVLVCDDDQKLAEDWVEAIRDVVTDDYRVLDAPDTADVRTSAQELVHRRSVLRQGEKSRKGSAFLTILTFWSLTMTCCT